MKISEIKHCAMGEGLQKTRETEDAPVEFERLLGEEAAKLSETAGEAACRVELGALSSVTPFQLSAVRNDFSAEYQQAELAVEGAIARMEKLQLALQNSHEGLKSVGAAIDELAVGVEAVQQSVVSLPENHQLRQMADELAVLAHVESVKYRRGDYL